MLWRSAPYTIHRSMSRPQVEESYQSDPHEPSWACQEGPTYVDLRLLSFMYAFRALGVCASSLAIC